MRRQSTCFDVNTRGQRRGEECRQHLYHWQASGPMILPRHLSAHWFEKLADGLEALKTTLRRGAQRSVYSTQVYDKQGAPPK